MIRLPVPRFTIALVVGAILCLAGGVARAGDEEASVRAWEAVAHYDLMTFSRDRDDWHTYRLLARRYFGRDWLAVEVLGTHRFSKDEAAVAVEGLLNLWPRAYGTVRFQVSTEAEILPRTDTAIGLVQGFGPGWEISGTYRHLNLPAADLHVAGVSLAKYLGDWYFGGRMLFMTTAGQLDVTQGLFVRRYLWNADTYLQVDGGLGREVVDVAAGPTVQSRRVGYVGLRFQTFFTRWLGLGVSGTYRDEERGPVGRGVSFDLLLRW